MRADLAKWRALTRAERRILVRAWCWLLVTRVALGCLPLKPALALLAGARAAARPSPNRSNPAPERVVGLVEAAAIRHVLVPTCLEKALVGLRLLGGLGTRVELVVGASRSERFAAHAWLEEGARVITPGQFEDHYQPLLRLRVVTPS